MAKKPIPDDEMSELIQKLDSLARQQDWQNQQMTYMRRLIEGDKMLETLKPTGMVNDIKHMYVRQEKIEKDVREVVDWFNDRSKKRYIVSVDLIQWGKFIAWATAVGGSIVGLFIWLGRQMQK
jgi:hypothetical protein